MKARAGVEIEEVDPFLEEHIAAIAGKNRIDFEISPRKVLSFPKGRAHTDLVNSPLASVLGLPCPAGYETSRSNTLPRSDFWPECPHRPPFSFKTTMKMNECREWLSATSAVHNGCARPPVRLSFEELHGKRIAAAEVKAS
jgi:TPP-dependent indolepyruvate ferredoxin oxidoreductase alpha subunit